MSFASRATLRTLLTGSLFKVCKLYLLLLLKAFLHEQTPIEPVSRNAWNINAIACLSAIFVVPWRCHSRITMTRDSYFAIKVTN